MKKPLLFFLFLAGFLLSNLFPPLSSFSQTTPPEEETFTITTYYPAPYGVYKEMRAKRMAVGDNYYNGSRYCWPPDTCTNQIDGISSPCWPSSSCNTDLIVEGNVGIGTAAPGGKLEVIGANDVALLKIGSSVSTEQFNFTRSSATGALSIQGDQSGFRNILLAPTGGNVGIGTAAPGGKLEVIGANDVALLKIGSSVSTEQFNFTRSSATGALSIQGDQSGFRNILLAPTGGNVGIGTTTFPATNPKLYVIGSVEADAFRAFETSGVYAFIEAGPNDGNADMGGF